MTRGILHLHREWKTALLLAGALVSAAAGLPAAVALALGICAAMAGLNAHAERTGRWAQRLLQLSVAGLGAGIDLPAVARAGIDGFGITLFSIAAILMLGCWLGGILGVGRETRLLISAGTAICGGSAIAAVAGVLKPRSQETAVALGVVFILNAVALLLFPFIGRQAGLSETAFAWWAAIAIHDTSSVVGAGLAYGPDALLLATTVKLARSLWIVPLALLIARQYRPNTGETTGTAPGRNFPWFIIGFVALAAAVWLFPVTRDAGEMIFTTSRHLLSATLFLIGAGLAPRTLVTVGWRPLALGISLWIPTAAVSLAAVLILVC